MQSPIESPALLDFSVHLDLEGRIWKEMGTLFKVLSSSYDP